MRWEGDFKEPRNQNRNAGADKRWYPEGFT